MEFLTTDLGAWFCLWKQALPFFCHRTEVFHRYIISPPCFFIALPHSFFDVRPALFKSEGRYLCRIFVWLDVAEIAVVLFLQLMDIRDLTQTLWMTHVMIGLAVLYFIYTICNKFYHHTTTHALWICTIGHVSSCGDKICCRWL